MEDWGHLAPGLGSQAEAAYCVHRLAATARDPKHTLEAAKKDKLRRYQAMCLTEGIVFVPLPAEVLGGWEDNAVKEISSIAAALGRQTGQEEGQAVRHLFQRLSIAIMKANASMWIAGEPDPVRDEISGELH